MPLCLAAVEEHAGVWRIADEAHDPETRREEGLEVLLVQLQAERDPAHQNAAEVMHRTHVSVLEERLHLRELCWPFVHPV
eukprot:510245-Rhodomonas_salina.2